VTENTKQAFNLPRVGIAYASKNKKVLRVCLLDENGQVNNDASYFFFIWELNDYFDTVDRVRQTGVGKKSISVYKSTPMEEQQTEQPKPKTKPKPKTAKSSKTQKTN